MLRYRTLLLMWFVFLGSLNAHARTWEKHTFATDRFEVEFSGKVTIKPTALDAESAKKVVRSTDYLQDMRDYAYNVTVTLTKESPNFDQALEAQFEWLKCKIIEPIKNLRFIAGRAAERSGADCMGGTAIIARWYTSGLWFYQVFAFYKQDGGDPSAARHFVESFRPIGLQ